MEIWQIHTTTHLFSIIRPTMALYEGLRYSVYWTQHRSHRHFEWKI